MATRKTHYSKRHLAVLKKSSLMAIARKKRVKVSKDMTKDQIINKIHPVHISCTIAGKQLHSPKKRTRTKGGRRLRNC